MAFLKSPPASPSSSLRLPSLLPRRSSLPRNLLFFPKFNPPFKSLSNSTISFPSLSPPNALPTTDQEILETILQSDDKRIGNLPGVRIFENDLARLNIIGDVSSEQAITAAAADGGDAAEEHLASGMSAMVIETVFPVGPDDHSTISTRLVSSRFLFLSVFGFVLMFSGVFISWVKSFFTIFEERGNLSLWGKQ